MIADVSGLRRAPIDLSTHASALRVSFLHPRAKRRASNRRALRFSRAPVDPPGSKSPLCTGTCMELATHTLEIQRGSSNSPEGAQREAAIGVLMGGLVRHLGSYTTRCTTCRRTTLPTHRSPLALVSNHKLKLWGRMAAAASLVSVPVSARAANNSP